MRLMVNWLWVRQPRYGKITDFCFFCSDPRCLDESGPGGEQKAWLGLGHIWSMVTCRKTPHIRNINHVTKGLSYTVHVNELINVNVIQSYDMTTSNIMSSCPCQCHWLIDNNQTKLLRAFCKAVEKLQTKWLGDFVVKCFSCKGADAWQRTEDGLKVFLPESFVGSNHIISRVALEVLELIHTMIYRGETLKEKIDKLTTILNPDKLVGDYRAFLRVKNMTQFKKLQQVCHAKIAGQAFDRDNDEKAALLSRDLPQIEKELLQVADSSGSPARLASLLDHVMLLHGLKQKSGALPQGADSKHFQLREQANALSLRAEKVLEDALGFRLS